MHILITMLVVMLIQKRSESQCTEGCNLCDGVFDCVYNARFAPCPEDNMICLNTKIYELDSGAHIGERIECADISLCSMLFGVASRDEDFVENRAIETICEQTECGVVEHADNCICRVRGDPVVQDCDGQLLTLRGEGYFEIASSDGNEACPAFRSFVYDSVVEDDGLVIPIDLYIYVMGKTIQIKRDMTVWVDGVQVALPWNGMGISITMSDGYVKVVLSETCDVEFAFLVEGDLSKIYVQIPGSLFNNVDGLCGNFNGDPDDDLALEDGTPSDDRNEISDSYKLDVLPPNVP